MEASNLWWSGKWYEKQKIRVGVNKRSIGIRILKHAVAQTIKSWKDIKAKKTKRNF